MGRASLACYIIGLDSLPQDSVRVAIVLQVRILAILESDYYIISILLINVENFTITFFSHIANN
jgi:hypothetical protein